MTDEQPTRFLAERRLPVCLEDQLPGGTMTDHRPRPVSARANRRVVAVVGAVVMFASACGGSSDSEGAEPGETSSPTSLSTTSTTSSSTTNTSTSTPTSSTEVTDLGQPAIWPAADVVFPTPEAAATDFVTQVLGVPGLVGEFRQGDTRSGEIDVLFGGEGGGREIVRSMLLMRQLGPSNGWFVLAAINPNAEIQSPESGSEASAGPVTVSGVGRGFEGALVVEAYVAGETEPIDSEVAQGGALADPEPFSVTLDLTGASPGEVVSVVVRGGVGHEEDPGDFGAISVVIPG